MFTYQMLSKAPTLTILVLKLANNTKKYFKLSRMRSFGQCVENSDVHLHEQIIALLELVYNNQS